MDASWQVQQRVDSMIILWYRVAWHIPYNVLKLMNESICIRLGNTIMHKLHLASQRNYSYWNFTLPFIDTHVHFSVVNLVSSGYGQCQHGSLNDVTKNQEGLNVQIDRTMLQKQRNAVAALLPTVIIHGYFSWLKHAIYKLVGKEFYLLHAQCENDIHTLSKWKWKYCNPCLVDLR